MLSKKIFLLSVSIIAVSLLNSCGRHASNDDNAAKQFCISDSLLKNVTFDTLHSELVNSELTLSGKITFNEDNVAKVFPLVSGHVSFVKVSLGDHVEKGQVLAIIRSSDMAGYYNEYKSSQSELAIAKKNLEVTSSLRNSGVSSDKDYLVAQGDYQKALAQFNKISEVLKINGSSFSASDSTGSGYVIKAPISGFIVEKNITVGMDIRLDAGDNLFTISDLKEVWATANVFESDISKIQEGADADVSTLSYPDKKFSGKIDKISNILDPDTKVMIVKIRIENKDYSLKPGMFAHIAIRLPEDKKMLAIKTNSIIFDDGKSYLLRYRGKCNITIQRVNIFKSFNDKSFIECDSLRDGEITVARNGLFIFTELKTL